MQLPGILYINLIYNIYNHYVEHRGKNNLKLT